MSPLTETANGRKRRAEEEPVAATTQREEKMKLLMFDSLGIIATLALVATVNALIIYLCIVGGMVISVILRPTTFVLPERGEELRGAKNKVM